jgi:dihydroneopterin aldolase
MGGGERGERWRMMVRLLTRHGIEDEEAFRPQPFSLIVTIADPERRARVYDEMAQIVANRYQSQNLTVRAAARVKARQ